MFCYFAFANQTRKLVNFLPIDDAQSSMVMHVNPHQLIETKPGEPVPSAYQLYAKARDTSSCMRQTELKEAIDVRIDISTVVPPQLHSPWIKQNSKVRGRALHSSITRRSKSIFSTSYHSVTVEKKRRKV